MSKIVKGRMILAGSKKCKLVPKQFFFKKEKEDKKESSVWKWQFWI